MKLKTLLFTIGLAVLTNLYGLAQTQPPNGDFEIWIPAGGSTVEPQSWGTLNQNAQGPQFPEVATKVTDAMSGFALRLENRFFQMQNDTLPGMALLNGTFPGMGNPPVGGLPYTDKPDSLVFWVKGSPQGSDVAWVQAFLTKWNGNSQDTLTVAEYSYSSTISSYTRIAVAFAEKLAGTPDTLNIILRAGMTGGIPTDGSFMFIDDLMFSNVVGIEELTYNNQFSVYPNPAVDEFFVKGKITQATALELYDIMGRQVYRKQAANNLQQVDVSGMVKGIYVWQLGDARGKVVIE